MQPSFAKQLNLLITIVNRDRGQVAVDILLKEGVLFHRIALGRGTAETEILDLLGIGDTPKDIIFSVLPSEGTRKAMRRLRNTLRFDNPGHGIAFTVPINSVAGHRTLKHLGGMREECAALDAAPVQKEKTMDEKRYDLVIAIVNNGHADEVMDAARSAGARGGTVFHARGAGIKEAEKFFGIMIQPEKEMLFILTTHEVKRDVMEAICQHCGITTDAHGMVFSVPAYDVMGVAQMLHEDDEDDE